MKGREHPQRDMVCFSRIRTRIKQCASFLKTSRIGSSLDVALIPHLQARKAAQEIVAIRAEVFALAWYTESQHSGLDEALGRRPQRLDCPNRAQPELTSIAFRSARHRPEGGSHLLEHVEGVLK
jgi:hypothetical protein